MTYAERSAIEMDKYNTIPLLHSAFIYLTCSDANDSSVLVNQTYPAAATKWLAPEILVEKRVSKKTDIYGICVVLWEVLHG